MMFNLFNSNQNHAGEAPVIKSKLFDEKSFYLQFLLDLEKTQDEVIIESPFITNERTRQFSPIFERLLTKNIKIHIFTRDPKEHTDSMEVQAEDEIRNFEVMGVQTFMCAGNFHRKLAIIDRKVLWEGSLNILSQSKSREIMRRFEDSNSAQEMFNFLDLGRFV